MRRERNFQQQAKKKVKQIWRKKDYCSHCDRGGHQRAMCWRLYPKQHLKDKVSVQKPVETVVRQANAPQGDDPFTLISERWFFHMW